jgi:hypothetical protein
MLELGTAKMQQYKFYMVYVSMVHIEWLNFLYLLSLNCLTKESLEMHVVRFNITFTCIINYGQYYNNME